jgi:hypothetical protein
MSRFENLTTGAVFSVDDSKDHRYAGDGYKQLDGSPAAPAAEPAAEGYTGTNDELRAEIARRNEGRDEADLLSTEGNKADLIATLEADDNQA